MRTLLPLLLLAPLASADVHSATAWAQGDAGSNFSLVHFDLDDQTGILSVHAEYEGLEGDLIQVRLEDGIGNLWLDVPHDGGTEGFLAGNVQLTPAQVEEALTPQGRVVFLTTAHPAGEMVGHNGLDTRLFRSFPITGDQVLGGPGEVDVTGTGHIWLDEHGAAILSGQVSGLTSNVTSVELRGPAWHGETGPLIAEFTGLAQNGSSATFDLFMDNPGPPAQVLEDMRDGLIYFLVKTASTPNGAARGQGTSGRLGQEFCAPRSNSAAFIGAQLHLEGSVRASDNDITLVGDFFPANKPVLPLVGRGTGFVYSVAGSEGHLCLGGAPIGRLMSDFGFTDSAGSFTASPDLSSLPLPGGPGVQPGEGWTFQLWYRDNNPAATSNFSSAVWMRFR